MTFRSLWFVALARLRHRPGRVFAGPPEPGVERAMIDYRLYCRDGKHHIQDVILLRCASDGEAIIASHRRAARFLSCDLWAGGREIERFGE